MADELSAGTRIKVRSASICATGSSSIEAISKAIGSAHNTPDNGTPSSRRRRPAARSQSARISGGKSVRKRTVASSSNELKVHCNSEPRLTDDPNDPSAAAKKAHSRRGTSVYHRKSTAFLEIPDARTYYRDDKEEPDADSYRLRSFSFTSKGIVNRGDSFRRRNPQSNNSLAPSVANTQAPSPYSIEKKPSPPVQTYTVVLLGAQGVGKTALVSQFMTSECINAYDRQKESSDQSVFIMLDGEESELKFENVDNFKDIDTSRLPDAFLVIYSVVDKMSFLRAEHNLIKILEVDQLRNIPVILVGNKVDLARSKSVSSQDGRYMACAYHVKFIEISVGINHNIDELLVGILSQIRLRSVDCGYVPKREVSTSHWYKSRNVVRVSLKARQLFTWLFGKDDPKLKNCENLHVL